jgi:sugar O-acyltransferase (sialic acid O-acetyltransferase NeuD family)
LMHIALGKPSLKSMVTKKCDALNNITLINAIHPSAIILPTVKLGIGIFVGAGAIINTDATIMDGALINTQAVVEHDTVVGEFANISPTVCLGGRTTIGDRAFIGSGSVVLARTSIGADSIIGMGAIVTKDIPRDKIAYGVPARIVKNSEEADWNKIL